ncbi:rolling circle replication-associated protein [Pseudoramibacter alactolyticus]|uniref:rolling circle replication-associated protein n=1 Tax=Pseudoramibacter alactolyticus TaxID=113287 RepID=UPI002354EF94|nr:hypothetical protein [Pseudoramibacter alactolyticus]MBM6968660.1 hypothetical protein [Pseudoramibacter alactolyticus]
MAYKQMTIKAGAVIEVIKYQDWAHGHRRKGTRGRRQKRSSESQQRHNAKKAEDELRWKLNAGCEAGDYHMILTYAGDAPDPDTAKRHLKNFLDRLRRLYAKDGHAFRWLAVTEYKGKRIHHHLILKQGPELFEIIKKWQHGRPKVVLLDDSGNYGDLAAYLIKETAETFRDPDALCRKRWTCSRNWPKPIITKQVIRRRQWVKSPRPFKGYYIDKSRTYEGITAEGYPYQHYTMVRLN